MLFLLRGEDFVPFTPRASGRLKEDGLWTRALWPQNMAVAGPYKTV